MASFSSVCGQVGFANIATYNGGISLYGIKWQTAPLSSQQLLVQYKITGDPTWLNASTGWPVDINGNIQSSRLEILSNPVSGTTYDIKVVSQCGGIAYETTFTVGVPLFSASYLIDNFIYNICGTDAVLLYSDTVFSVGAIMYVDAQLTTPLTGYSFIENVDTGDIYALNPSTGEVGSITSFSCMDAISGQYILDTSTGTVCSGTITTLYSNGTPDIGSVLYTDAALSIPVTGSTIVLFLSTGIIYNLNSGTGVVGSNTGVTCTANPGVYYYAKVLADIPNATPTQLYTPGSFGKGAIMYTVYPTTTPLTGYNYISLNGEIRTINTTTGEVGCLAVNC